jgi:hypothetical protein
MRAPTTIRTTSNRYQITIAAIAIAMSIRTRFKNLALLVRAIGCDNWLGQDHGGLSPSARFEKLDAIDFGI